MKRRAFLVTGGPGLSFQIDHRSRYSVVDDTCKAFDLVTEHKFLGIVTIDPIPVVCSMALTELENFEFYDYGRNQKFEGLGFYFAKYLQKIFSSFNC